MNIFHRHRISFRHAFDGLVQGFASQPNFKIHSFLSLLAMASAWYLKISVIEWAVILFTIATGLAIELINTSIEYTVDLLTQKYELLAKYAKDTAAAAMLTYAFFSILIAGLIFLPKIFV